VVKDRVESRYLGLVEDILRDVSGRSRRIVLEVMPQPGDESLLPDPLDQLLGPAPTTEPAAPTLAPVPPGGGDARARTFDDFVRGPSNRFAHAAAFAVA